MEKRVVGLILSLLVLTGLFLVPVGCSTPEPTAAPQPATTPQTPATSAPASPPAAEKVYNLTIANQNPPADRINQVIQGWGNWLNEASGGRINLTLIPSAQAAASDKIYDAAVSGLIDIADQHLGSTPGRFPLMEVIELPFIFEDPSSRSAALTCMALAEKYPKIREQFGDVKLLGFHFAGQCHFFTTKKPINTLDDVKGQLILTVGRGSSTAVELLGGVPQPGDPTQVYDMLSKGVVDGMAISWFGAQIFNISSVCNYATEAGLPDAPFVIGMNMDTWNSLPADLQQLFVGDNFMQLVEAFGYDFDVHATIPAEEKIDQDLKSRSYPGVTTLSEDERASFATMVEPMEEAWLKEATAIVGEDMAKAILADTKAFAKQYNFETTPKEKLEALLKGWGTPGY